MKILSLILLLVFFVSLKAQNIPSTRRTDWSNPGIQGILPTPTTWKNIMSFGGNNTGSGSNNTAFNSAVASLSGGAGVIYFPAGTYLFNATVIVPANVIVKGASSDSTFFNFNLSGATANCFNVIGSASATSVSVASSVHKGATALTLSSASGINAGDYIEFRVDATGFMNDAWAMNDLAQISKVASVAGNVITLTKPLRWNYNLSSNPRVYTLTPIQKVGFECFKLSRLDTSSNQSTLINFQYAANCWVKGVETFKTTFAHVVFSKSVHCELSESYLHHAWDYGAGGRAYGVVLQSSSSECLVQNNIFERLRHSFLFQSGANGNVTAYNFSTDPYWTQGALPANSSGEITLHGNFPFMNLFEGNVLNNIVIDNSHSINGPFNTIFRNRASIWGIFMNAGAGDSTNFVNNEIVSNTPLGFLLSPYVLTGIGNYEYGNNRGGTITIPSGTVSPPDWISYYLSSQPSWFTTGSLPTVGYANAFNTGTIPARTRFITGVLGRCGCPARIACSFNALALLTYLPTCCGASYQILEFTPTTGNAPYSIFADGVSYILSGATLQKMTFMPPYNRTINISGTDKNGCTYSSNIVLP